MTDDSLIWLQGPALVFARDPLDTHTERRCVYAGLRGREIAY